MGFGGQTKPIFHKKVSHCVYWLSRPYFGYLGQNNKEDHLKIGMQGVQSEEATMHQEN